MRIVWVLVFAVAMFGTGQAAGADRLALWHIVHDQCVVDFTASGNPAPCAAVVSDGDEGHGYAVLKDIRGATQFLLIPTNRITGIEDPAVLAPGVANYFADAWRAIGAVAERAHVALPRDGLSLAINAVTGRSQDQLHIHMDCIRVDVRDALHRLAGGIGPSWAPLPEAIDGRHYLAMHIDGASLDAANPFRRLADGVPGGVVRQTVHPLPNTRWPRPVVLRW